MSNRKITAYLRVSTDSQDVDNQRHGILEYANAQGFSGLEFVEDTASGKKKWRQRKLGKMLDELPQGSVLIFAEISRIARSTLQVLEVLEKCTEQKISVHIAKQKMIFDGSLQATITATVLGMAAEIEREFISMRTKEALAARKKAGKILGRPPGKAEKLKLDAKRDRIQKLLDKNLSQRAIAKLLEIPPSSLNDYIKRTGIKPSQSLS